MVLVAFETNMTVDSQAERAEMMALFVKFLRRLSESVSVVQRRQKNTSKQPHPVVLSSDHALAAPSASDSNQASKSDARIVSAKNDEESLGPNRTVNNNAREKRSCAEKGKKPAASDSSISSEEDNAVYIARAKSFVRRAWDLAVRSISPVSSGHVVKIPRDLGRCPLLCFF